MALTNLQTDLLTAPPEQITFEDAAARFLDWCKTTEYRDKPETARRIKTSFATLTPFFEQRPVSAITAAEIDDYKEWRTVEHQVRPVTVKHDLDALSTFFRKFAVRRGMANANPTAEVTKPSDKDSNRMVVLAAEEEQRYFAEAATRDSYLYAVARLMIEQGCRPEELFALRPADVDLNSGELRITGGKSRAARRRLPLTAASAEILAPLKAAAQWWIFPSRRYGAARHIGTLQGIHDRVCIAARVSFVLYDLRHTYATRMVESGCDLPTLAALLGHGSLRMVTRYVHPTAAHQREAMQRFQQRFGRRLGIVGEQ